MTRGSECCSLSITECWPPQCSSLPLPLPLPSCDGRATLCNVLLSSIRHQSEMTEASRRFTLLRCVHHGVRSQQHMSAGTGSARNTENALSPSIIVIPAQWQKRAANRIIAPSAQRSFAHSERASKPPGACHDSQPAVHLCRPAKTAYGLQDGCVMLSPAAAGVPIRSTAAAAIRTGQ